MGEQKSSTSKRVLQIILGIGALILAFVILFYPGFGLATLIVFLSFGLMMMGFWLFGVGLIDAKQSGAIRWLSVIVGLIVIAFSVIALVYPGLGTATLILILAIGIMSLGFGAILQGVNSEQSGWIRGLLILVGIVILSLGIASIVYPGLASLTLVVLLSLALMMVGVASLAKGLVGE